MSKSSPSTISLPESLRAFFAGMTEPSMAALVIAGIVFGLAGLWSVQNVQGFVASSPELLASSDGDDYVFVTAATIDISARKPDERQ